MLIKYLREDEKGTPMRVEVWRDEKTGEFIRIKRVRFGRIIWRTDIYASEDPKGFEEAIKEELDALTEYGKSRNQLVASAREFVMRNYEESRGELFERLRAGKSGQM